MQKYTRSLTKKWKRYDEQLYGYFPISQKPILETYKWNIIENSNIYMGF